MGFKVRMTEVVCETMADAIKIVRQTASGERGLGCFTIHAQDGAVWRVVANETDRVTRQTGNQFAPVETLSASEVEERDRDIMAPPEWAT